MKRIAIYLRVSTARQDTDNQRRELEAVAERSGWNVVRRRRRLLILVDFCDLAHHGNVPKLIHDSFS